MIIMKYEFLKQFPRRMKQTGMYSYLARNCALKNTFNEFKINEFDERINLVYGVLLFIMEESLKDSVCTRDDIASYISDAVEDMFNNPLTFKESEKLAGFILDVILSNEGRQIYFSAYDFEEKKFKKNHLSYIKNFQVETITGVSRASYKLTDDGYNLILSTLEIENNMKITIKELILKMHLDKKSFDKAKDDVKDLFNLLRIQFQKMDEAMEKIRRNALSYSVAEYKELLEGDIDTIQNTKKKFTRYKEKVLATIESIKESEVNKSALSKEEKQNLEDLNTINYYLNKSLDEHQKILEKHFDVKILYDKELEELSRLSMIHRFSIRKEVYDKIIENPDSLKRIEVFLRPLFNKNPDKIYNPNKALAFQKNKIVEEEDDTEETIDFDLNKWETEKKREREEKNKLYEDSLKVILLKASSKEKISLNEISKTITDKEKEILFPSTEIFKEIMVELLKAENILIDELKREREEFLLEKSFQFQINEGILKIIESDKNLSHIKRILIKRKENNSYVNFDGVKNAAGEMKSVRCSDIVIRIWGD